MLFPGWFKKPNDPQPVAVRRIRLLILSVYMDDRLLLKRIAKQYDWEPRFAFSTQGALRLASQTHYDVILCDRHQAECPWQQVMSELSVCAPGSCIFLISRNSNNRLWGEVLEQGGFDILLRPFTGSTIANAVQAALPFVYAESEFTTGRISVDHC